MTLDGAPALAAPSSGSRAQLAAAIAAAVDDVGGARRTPGWGVPVGTQRPGGTIVGVVLRETWVEVHVVAEAVPLGAVADAVRAATGSVLTAAGDRRPVDVVIEDLDFTDTVGWSR